MCGLRIEGWDCGAVVKWAAGSWPSAAGFGVGSGGGGATEISAGGCRLSFTSVKLLDAGCVMWASCGLDCGLREACCGFQAT